MSHPELDAVPPMVANDGTHQRPLTVAQLISGERRSVPGPWARRDAEQAELAAESEPSPPVIASLEQLEALASRPVLSGDPDEPAVADRQPQVEAVSLASFAPAAIACEPKLPTWSRRELRERMAHDTLDRLAGLAEHRLRWPLGDKAETERRCLAQVDALICLGVPALEVVAGATAPSPWSSWAIVFALACVEGREAVAAVYDHVASLGAEHRQHRRRAAEAFAASHNPHVIPLGRACLATAGCEPFALELLSLRGQLSPSDLQGWLQRPDPETQATALRAYSRLHEPPADVRALEALIDTSDPELAWEAARALTFWRSGAPLAAIRHGGTLPRVLAERAIELVVLSGHHDDARLVQRLVRRLEPSAGLLDVVARLGHPGTWAFLAHYLGDPLLADDAVAALRTAFGDLVDEDHRLEPDRWEQAIAALRLDEGQRVRRGKPWSAAVVAAECSDPELSAHDVALRLDELRARSHVHLPAALCALCARCALWAFTPLHQTFATDLHAALRRAGALR